MANSKNTIQKIPLNGTLNMNTLKTEVKQFEGFNEKNSTVFGGSLSPFYDKSIVTQDSADSSYTVFNSKGNAYTLRKTVVDIEDHIAEYGITLWKDNKRIYSGNDDIYSDVLYETHELNVPIDAVVAAEVAENIIIYVTKDGEICKNGERIGSFDIDDIWEAQIWKDHYIAVMSDIKCQVLQLDNNWSNLLGKTTVYLLETPVEKDDSPLITKLNDTDYFYFISKSGRVKKGVEQKATCISFTNNQRTTADRWKPENFGFSAPKDTYRIGGQTNTTYEIQQFAYRSVYSNDKYSYINNDIETNKDRYCGTLNGFVPCPVGAVYSNWGSIYYQNGQLISIGMFGRPITSCLSFGRNMIYYGNSTITYKENNDKWYSYRFPLLRDIPEEKLHLYLKNIVLDDRYIFIGGMVYDIEEERFIADDFASDWILSQPPYSNTAPYYTVKEGKNISYSVKATRTFCVNPNFTDGKGVIDIALTQSADDEDHTYVFTLYNYGTITLKIPAKSTRAGVLVSTENNNTTRLELMSVDSGVISTSKWSIDIPAPATMSSSATVTEKQVEYMVPSIIEIRTYGSIYGGGYNAGYTVSNANFVGYLPNPFVVEKSPPIEDLIFPDVPKSVQLYCSTGDTVKSAKYVGNNQLYADTLLATNSDGNIMLPISSSAELKSGYSNNELVVELNTSYPLIYYNNNQKIYGYYLLSGIENMTDTFSLQGQSYTIDNNNIYAVSFNNGIVSSVTPVCYKKNMEYKGVLPTQAVFWSNFNKTFYSYTGDRVLTKMFEASDIDEIRYFGQNPSSLSLWFCTNSGIYIISDTDMYKLDYNAIQISFQKDYAIIVTKNDDSDIVIHYISLWDNLENSEMVPVKLKTAYYGLGAEQKSVMDCWYIRLFNEKHTEGEVKVKVNTITDVTRHSEEKTFKINPSDYDENNIVYLRYQPKYQECTAMQLELESNIGIYELAIGVNATDSTAQVSKLNF